jgi:outer membrane protein OmpA-like peptidoglycan-associated protein
MMKKLFAVAVAAVLLTGCEVPAPLATAPVWESAVPKFTVFFDTASAKLSPEALNTLLQAASAYKAKGTAKVSATGYTDTVGTADYNKGLSLRRAQAVKTALNGMGVPGSAITVTGLGEENPKVKTGDGVAEPQNRRVEVLLK